MAQPWERDWSAPAAGNTENKKPWERGWSAPAASAADSEGRTAADVLKDTGISMLKMAVNVPQAAVGLLDLGTQGYAGKTLEGIGFRPEAAKQMLDEAYSAPQQAANKAVREADGFIPTAKAALENPSVIAHSAIESLGMMGAGGLVARGILGVAPRVASWLAGGLGEGVVGAGSAAEQIRSESKDGLLTGKQVGAALASGAGTAALGAAGGKIAQRLGLPDVDTMLATGGRAALKSPAGFMKAVVGSGISEGVFEELPQSIQEQMWQNYATDKPLGDGVGNAAALGMLTGAAMGGAGGGFNAAASSLLKDKAAPEEAQAAAPTGTPVNAAELLGETPPAAAAAAAEPTEAEKALSAPLRITDLDRVQEIDQELAGQADAGKAVELTREREQLTANWPKTTPGSTASFTTEAGARVDGQYALVEADDLQTSHDANLRPNPAYPQELQPRDRTRAASEAQISSIVGKLDPARLGISADAATGAPIIGADGLVESGNARTIALKRVFDANGQKAQDYRAWLRQHADQFGLQPEQVDGLRRPVLVRVRTTPVNRAEFARQANASTVAQMSPAEMARADAARIDAMDDLQPDEQGDFATSRDFIRRFVGRLPATEQAGMIDAGGRLSSSGYARVRNAVLAKAYGDSPILTRMVESMDDNLRNLSRALMIAAPRVAQARSLVQAGRLHDADITPHLVSAVEELGRLKDEGTSVQDALAQMGIDGDTYTPETRDLLQFLSENMRRPRRMAEFVTAYFDALEAMGDPNQGSLLGDAEPPKTGDLMAAAKRAAQPGDANGNTDAAQDAVRRDDREAAKDRKRDAGQPAAAARDRGGNEGDGKPAAVAAANDSPADGDWRLFGPESGTLGIPRAEMPQVKVKRRPALYEFLAERGITNERVTLHAKDLKPSQAEYSKDKANRAAELLDQEDEKQIVLVSADNYVADGHHRWVAAQAADRDVQAVKFSAPIRELLAAIHEFPGATKSNESAGQAALDPRQAAVQDLRDGLADLGMILTKHQRAAMVPENTPGLMPTLVNIAGAAIRIVGTDLKRVVAWVRDAMKADAKLKPLAGKIDTATIRKAAMQALDEMQGQATAQAGLFDEVPAAADVVQGDLFSVAPPAAAKAAMIDGRAYDAKRDNYVPPPAASIIPKEAMDAADALLAQYPTQSVEEVVSAGDRQRAEALLAPALQKAAEAKVEFDQKVIDIARQTGAIGQQLAPIKGLARGAVKLIEEGFDVGAMKDLLRSTIVVKSYADAQKVVDAIESNFKLLRAPKNRTGDVALRAQGKDVVAEDPSKYGGYSDIMVNVVMPNGTIAEIQINVPQMLAAKAEQGHALYERLRSMPKGAAGFAELTAGSLAFYAAARAALTNSASVNLDQRAGQDLAGDKPASGAFSSSEKTLPSGKRTTDRSTPSPSDRSMANSQPGGNFDGTSIATSTAQSVASLPDLLGGVNDDSATDDRDSAQGTPPAAARKSGGKRRAAPVRAGDGGSDLFAGGRPDAGAANEGGLGQARADGMRRSDADGGSSQPRGAARRGAGVPAGRDIAPKSGLNYRFTDEDLSYEGSWFKKAEQNVAALELLKRLQADGRQATREEQKTLARWIGWGAGEIANSIFSPAAEKKAPVYLAFVEAQAAVQGLSRIEPSHPSYWTLFQRLSFLPNEPRLSYREAIPASRVTAKNFGLDSEDMRWQSLRARIQAAMTAEEWAEARRTTQYAHFTSKGVVRSMWAALDRFGFKGGTILEPGAGNGVFPGLMPEAMAVNSAYTGIEYDSITGGILKQLQPDERILVESFVDTQLPKNFFDVAIGNPPFSGSKILSDPEYRKHAFALHDYFFAKTIDRTKPGGLVMFVTSRYTMDKLGDKARQYLAERADLVGAIRLPQTAFKQNAGTDVVTDVLFLRKKVPGETFQHGQAWLKTAEVKTADGPAVVNEYFAAHPEMVLGKPALARTMYAKNEYTVLPPDGDIEDLFAKAVESMPADIYTAQRGSAAEAAKVREIDFNPKAQKEGNYYLNDKGVLMQRENGVGQAVLDKKPADVEVIKAFVPLRDALKQAHYDQLNDGDWEPSLKRLQAEYEKFVAKHGRVNQFVTKTVRVKVDELDDDGSPTGRKIDDEEQRRVYPLRAKLQDDPDWTLVFALEKVNDDTGEITPSAFLTDRVLGKPAAAAIQGPHDAMLSVLNDVGRVDMADIAARLDMTEEEAAESLGSAVYRDPEGDWVTSDEYLSGNVKRKLEVARAAAKSDRRYERNVQALEAAQPAPKSPAQISAGIGMNWIPGSDYAQFLRETAGVRSTVAWNEATRQWVVSHEAGYSTAKATADWGTGSRHAGEILEHALTGRPIKITKTVGTGSNRTTVFDADATEAANQKLDALREAFERWIWADPDRANRLVQVYNDRFNTTVPRTFDGRHLTLPGASKKFRIFDHVKRGAWRIVQSGNTYLAHAVGSGKTFQMVISAMEQKRLGLIKKPMMVVPNHMLQQFAREWQELYPAARLMVADEANFHTDNRRRFVSRVAMSDLDGVIITHSAFKLMDLDHEFKQKIIEEQLVYMRAALEQAEDEEGGGAKRSTRVKQIEKQIENLEEKLKAAFDGSGKDKNVRFDELGVDMLYVDEAHEFRKLDYGTSRQVKGIQPAGSQRSLDLYIKARYLEEKSPGRSLVMASGTPVTNTLAELFTVQRFMDRQTLIDRGIEDFDSWASMFGRERTALEPNAAGKYEPVTRFSKFVNVPELTQMFREFADVVTADQLAAMLGDKRPKVDGGARKIIVTPKSTAYGAYQKTLEQRVQASRDWRPSKDQPSNPDPIIKIIGDGRLAAIDMRFVSPGLPSDPDSKLNRMIDDVIAKFKETAGVEYLDDAGNIEPAKGSAIMVFSDLGFGAGVAATRGFNARAWFEKRLRDAGVPMAQVAFMSDYKKSTEKLKLFKDVNAGRVRLLIGSSKNMGTGVNAQQRLKAMFHLDSPWYPSDLEQREGRIIRQGNKNKLVQIYAYAAKGTYDENMWKMLASKQFFIDQALNGDENLREVEDLDSQSQYDMAAAMVADDPRVLQLAGARAEIEKLQRLFRAHEDQRMKFRRDYQWAQDTVAWGEKALPEAEAAAAKVPDLSGDNFRAKAGKTTIAERVKWGEALAAAYKDLSDRMQPTQTIGEIAGYQVRYVARQGDSSYTAHVELATPEPRLLFSHADSSAVGIAMTAQNAVADIARQPGRIRDQVQRARDMQDSLRERLSTPFPMAEMLAAKIQEAADLEQALQERAWRVERVDTGLGFDVQASSAEKAIEKAIASNGGTVADWRAIEAKIQADRAVGPGVAALSRGAGGGIAMPALRAVADRVATKLPGLPPVKVLASADDAPEALRAYIAARGAMADVEGALHDGTIYLFASGIADETRAEHVLAEHEAAHAGLRGLLGAGLKQAMTAIYNQNAAVRQRAKRLMADGMPLADAVEEVIVDIPTAELAQLKGWRGLVERMRDTLKARGFERLAAWLDGLLAGHTTQQQRADLAVAALVREARGYVGKRRPAGTALSTKLADDLAAQEAWLTEKAKAAGYADIEDMLAQDFPMFERLAAQWRAEHPADVMLSRAGQAPAAATAAERAEAIIQKSASVPKPLDAAARMLTRATGIERLTTMLYGKGAELLDRLVPERVKAGIVADYGVPEAVIDQRARMQGAQREQLRQAGGLIEKLATLTRAESRVAYEWMSGDDTRTADELMKDLPEESVTVLQDVRVMIDQLSTEAVRLGQLDAEAHKRHRFAYLRRSYFKHAQELTDTEKAGRQRAISILGDQYKGRGMVVKAPMKQVQNIAPTWWKRKIVDGKADTSLKGEKFLRLERRVARDAASADLDGFDADARRTKLAEVVYWPADEAVPTKYAEWTNAGKWEVRDTKAGDLILWRDFTKDERVKMGEIDEARYAIGKTLHRMVHDIEVGRYLEWLAQNHAKKPGETFVGTVVEASERYRDAFKPGEWVQVPDAKIQGTSVAKYGKLAGLYLPGPIWNDLRQVVGAQRIGPEWWRTMMTWWKTSKALAIDTPIPTPSGWTTMGEIKLGDPVFDEAGNVCHVMGATPVQLDRVCYEVAFSDGEKIVADAEHMWFTIMRGKPGVRTTEEILATLKEGTRGDANHHVPVAGALDLYDVPVPVHPYVLGAWLGDGDSNRARITQGERDAPQIIAHLEAAGVKCAPPSRDRRSSAMTFWVRRGEDGCTRGHGPSFMTARGDCRECANLSERLKRRGEFLPAGQHPSIQVRLREMNLFGNKHIPATYLRGSEEQRRELLMGLMDTDGHITKRGECAFTTTIPQLRDGVVELLRSLGYKPSCFEWQPACKGRPGKIAWRISFKAYADKPVFKLLRKRDRLQPPPARAQRSQTRSIVAITPVKSVPVRCIAVSSESRLYLAGRGMIPTHNTALSPGVHTNNVMSNFVMADWHDVSAAHVAKSLRIILAARSGDGRGALGRAGNVAGKAFSIADREAAKEIVARYEMSGGSIGGWVTQEIANDQLAPIVEALKKEVNATLRDAMPTEIRVYSAMQHVLHARFPQVWEAFKVSRTAEVVSQDAKNLIDLYQAEDDVFRLAAWLKAKEQGASDHDAGKVSRKSFLDYQINAPWVAAMRQTALPFVSFTYRALPMLLEVAAKRPHKILKLMAVVGALNALGVMIGGGGDDDERKLLPEEKSGRIWGMVPKLIRMPWNDAYGSPVYLDIRRWIPAGDVFDLGQGHAALPVPPSLMPGGPAAVLAEVAFNRSMFTGKAITLETDTMTEKARKVADHLWKAAMPNIVGVPGTYATDGVVGATTNRTDAFGREMSTTQAMASAMGVKVGSYPADVLRRNIIAKRNAEVNEIDMQISALKRQRQTNRIDADEFEEKMAAQQQKRAKLMTEAAEKLK